MLPHPNSWCIYRMPFFRHDKQIWGNKRKRAFSFSFLLCFFSVWSNAEWQTILPTWKLLWCSSLIIQSASIFTFLCLLCTNASILDLPWLKLFDDYFKGLFVYVWSKQCLILSIHTSANCCLCPEPIFF